jgi:hypothetical protein
VLAGVRIGTFLTSAMRQRKSSTSFDFLLIDLQEKSGVQVHYHPFAGADHCKKSNKSNHEFRSYQK